jgi:subtilisin family serine protease
MRFTALALAGGVALAQACSLESLNPVDGETAPSDGGGGTSVASVGGGGTVEVGRGDPSTFPASCLATCEEACDALESCGGGQSSLFPVDGESCLARCGAQVDGPFWDDISGNFRCCTSQASCDAVQHCGGWLEHPDAKASCDRLCGCFFGSSALAHLADGHQAPQPYRFAPHALMVEMPDARAALPALPSTHAERSGRYATVRFSDGSGMHTVAQLASAARLLPTFVDHRGRVSAATGRVFARAIRSDRRATLASVAGRHGAAAPQRVRLGSTLYTTVHADPWAAVDAVAELRAAGIEAELDMVRPHVFHRTPNDPLFPEQWHLRNTGQGESTEGIDARVSEAWDITAGDPQVLIAINDDGVDLAHPDFAGRLEPQLNYPSDWAAQTMAGEFGWHGTQVAGVAAAGIDDQKGGVGVCPGCRVIPHLLGPPAGFGGFNINDKGVADGFKRQVDAGAAVINNSWGPSTGNALYADDDMAPPPLPMVVSDAIQYAEDNGRGGLGTVIVFAAGNENTEHHSYGQHPLVVTVAAVGDQGLKAYYSSFGPGVTVAAPSNGGLTGITTTDLNASYTADFGGTSSAAPLVSGVLGLIFSANPALTAAQARTVLKDSASNVDRVYGAYSGGRSDYYGAGMVNAYVAVRMADGSCIDPTKCQAPSDDCGSHCGTRIACGPCRTHDDCAASHICQALPSLGRKVCVQGVGSGDCPAGTTKTNGFCLPTRETCGLCLGEDEQCNGRDDDCDGEADEEDVCEGAPRCLIDGPPCASGTVCAGVSCVPSCADDADCDPGLHCKTVKNQFGESGDAMGCIRNAASGCPLGCEALASSAEDEALASFVECMQDGQVACNGAFGCMSSLPIQTAQN